MYHPPAAPADAPADPRADGRHVPGAAARLQGPGPVSVLLVFNQYLDRHHTYIDLSMIIMIIIITIRLVLDQYLIVCVFY